MGAPPKTVLVLQHVPWEGPHRIAEAFGPPIGLRVARPLEGERLPAPEEVVAAIVMGGPMNVDDVGRYPALAEERRWIERALEQDLPLLGVCLGSQLIARALGAAVTPGPEPEIGWRPVTIAAPEDPLVGPLAPGASVLHWHGDRFDSPPGAALLASSDATPCQAFRHGSAWGVLFHPEADVALVQSWLAEDSMAAEARAALGPEAAELLLAGAHRSERELIARSGAGFEAFARLAAER